MIGCGDVDDELAVCPVVEDESRGQFNVHLIDDWRVGIRWVVRQLWSFANKTGAGIKSMGQLVRSACGLRWGQSRCLVGAPRGWHVKELESFLDTGTGKTIGTMTYVTYLV